LIGLAASALLASGCAVMQAGEAAVSVPAATQPTTTEVLPAPVTEMRPVAAAAVQPDEVGVAHQPAAVPVVIVPGAADSGAAPTVSFRFAVDPSEVHAAAKQVAGAIAEGLTTYETGASPSTVAARIVPVGERRDRLAATAAPLVHPGMWSRGTVVYPQLGGMRPDRCSVMVVVRQELGVGEQVEFVETRTLDVRLRKDGDGWVLDHLASAGGTRIARPDDLPAAASSVLDDPRIEIPDSARWDIYRGHTSNVLLELMADLADRTPYGVVVLASGHPHNVFATDRTSNHTVGTAVDVYLLGDTRVIDDRSDGSFTHDTVAWLYEHPSLRSVGSPWALDGVGGSSFTDVVHQDHLHIAVRG
jgi:hypothetical protein